MTDTESLALSVVLVTRNSADFVAAAISSLAGVAHEVIVVDNGSEDDTVAIVKRRAPEALLFENAVNRGFGAAANQGLRASRADLVMFLNPDAELLPGAVRLLITVIEAHPQLALVGPQLIDSSGGLQTSHAAFRWPAERFWGHLPRASRALRSWRVGPQHVQRGVGGQQDRFAVRAAGAVVDRDRTVALASATAPGVCTVDWVLGACMLGRRELLVMAGGFDEGYFMYAEDMDLCYRLWRQGYQIGYCPDARVCHLGNASGHRHFGEAREAAVIRGQLRFLRIHGGIVSDLAFRLLAVPFFLAKMAVFMAGAVVAPTPRARQHRADARRCLYVLRALTGLGMKRPRVPT